MSTTPKKARKAKATAGDFPLKNCPECDGTKSETAKAEKPCKCGCPYANCDVCMTECQ